MTDLEKLVGRIAPPDGTAAAEARQRWDSLAKPLGSLGLLEEAVVKIAALTGSADVGLDERALLVFCADNGVVARGVTQCGSEVTARVARALAGGTSTVNPMARLANCRVVPVDVGIRDFTGFQGGLDRRVRNGTADISIGPAMSREECIRAVLGGAALVKDVAAEGAKLIAVGEMGIGNTTTAAAVTAALLGLSPETAVGRGAGLSDAGLDRKREAVTRALGVNTPDPADPIDVLSKVGGLDLAAMCGAFLGGAACRVPVVIDGAISAAAALCAARLCPGVKAAMLASHVSAEPVGPLLLEALELKPFITAEMRLGEGGGAVTLLPLMDMALAVYNSGQTFEKLGIAAYEPQE